MIFDIELKYTPWLIIQDGDGLPELSGNPKSSYGLVMADSTLRTYIIDNFSLLILFVLIEYIRKKIKIKRYFLKKPF